MAPHPPPPAVAPPFSEAAATRDHAFCRALTAVTAQARSGFVSLTGSSLRRAWDDGGGDDETHFATKRKLPGALGCVVAREHSDGDDVLAAYRCDFPAEPKPGTAVAVLAARISGCIGHDAADRVAAVGPSPTADFGRRTFVIGISADRPDRVLLQLGGK